MRDLVLAFKEAATLEFFLRNTLVLLFCLTLPEVAVPQTSKGAISGLVLDQGGAAIQGAQVTAKDVQGTETRTVLSGSSGEFQIVALTPSMYTVTVSAAGFQTKEIEQVEIKASLTTSKNVTLDIRSTQTSINVETSGADIQTNSGELSSAITAKEILSLPVNSLNPIDLVLTAPGVTSVANRDNYTNGSSFSVDGLRPRANNFLIDGFDNNDQGIAGQALQPSNLEAVKEVSVLRNSYAAEFGRGGASVTNVVYRNGTNEIHGSAWERYSGSALMALTSEQKRSGLTATPRLVNNTFGFAVGGPIRRNKLFYFGSSQWLRIFGSETGNALVLPTGPGVSVLSEIAKTDSTAGLLVKSLGGLAAATPSSSINIGVRPGCADPCLIPVGTLIRTPTQQNTAYEYIARADYNANEANTLSVRYIGTQNTLTPDLFANSNALPTQDSYQGGPARNLGVFWTHLFTPTLVNEARFTWQQIDFSFEPLASTAASEFYSLPNITVAGFTGASFGGPVSNLPQGRGHDTYGYQEALSWTVGTHNMRVGTDISHFAINDRIPFNGRGEVDIVDGGDCSSIGIAVCTGLANFLDDFTGPAGSVGKQFGSPKLSFTQTTQAYYAQDSWKATQQLSLSYGVRYEYFGTPFNALSYPAVNLGSVLTDPLTTRVRQRKDLNNWAPRFGFAWNPGLGKTAIRGGGGVFYDGYFANMEDNVASSAPNTLGGTITAPRLGRGLSNAVELIPTLTPTVNPRASVSVIDAHLVSPLTYQWNINVERQLPLGFLGTLAYVGTRGERLFLNQDLNPGVNGVRLNSARGAISARTNSGDSIYHGLQADLRRSFRHGFLFEAAYTFSKSIDDGSEVYLTSGGSSYAQNPFDRRGDRGVSAFDRPHRAALTWIYAVPNLSGTRFNSALRYVLRDWQISGTAQLQSGAPDTIYFGGLDENGDLRSTNDRPDIANASISINLSNACLSSPTCITGIGLLQPDGTYADANTGVTGERNQFRFVSTEGRPGNLGRNTVRNDWTQDYTLAVERSITLPHSEHQQLEFRAEAINPANHPNPGLVSTNLLDPTFLNKDIVYTGGRVLNFWLKYRF